MNEVIEKLCQNIRGGMGFDEATGEWVSHFCTGGKVEEFRSKEMGESLRWLVGR